MLAYVLARHALAQAAAGGLIVLALGSLAARGCRQPVERIRIVLLTILAAVAVPCVGMLPIAPKWSVGVALATTATEGHSAAHTMTTPHPRESAARVESLQPTAVSAPTNAGTPRFAEWRQSVAGDIAGAPTAGSARRATLTWEAWALIAYGTVSAALAGWWLLGQMILWRISRASRSVPLVIEQVFREISGPAGSGVVLQESQTVALPFTFTWVRPVIILPSRLCADGDSNELRFCLAHEWSHIERHDARAWNLTAFAGFLLFYQPLFWWLRRQLRLCQDYLADDRASGMASAEDYAAYLVRLARARRAGLALPALGLSDRRSNLFRRVSMLVQEHEPLQHRCRTLWSVGAAVSVAVVMLIASGLNLDAAAVDDKATAPQSKAAPVTAKPAGDSKKAGETLHYTGTVRDKNTNKPIAGATVTVRRSILRSEANNVLQETRHTTAADGTYHFTIPPEQSSSPFLYIELDVEHPDYATRAGFGYALSMTRKNEKLGERPFFETIEMRPAKSVTGRVETPDGEPAAGVDLLAYSRADKLPKGQFEYGSFAKAKTDAQGKFRLPITTPGQAALWILPKAYAPELHVLADGKRGDLGTFALKKGVTVTGRAFDVQGKPLAGLYVEADRERGHGPDFEALGQMMVADAIRRTAETDAQGRFTFDPLPPGTYHVTPTDSNHNSDRSAGWKRRELPGVFTRKKITITENEVPDSIEVRASPVVVIEGRWVDSKGNSKSGWASSVFGRIDGSFWHARTHLDEQGKFSLQVPHGLEDVTLDIITNEHATTRHRLGKDKPLEEGRNVKLGTLDHDVKGIEIVRYTSPIIVVNATNQAGQQIAGFTAAVEYTGPGPKSEKRVHVVGGGKKKDVVQDEQYDGRYRTSQLLPDREVNVTVSAEGFESQTRKLTLPEGKSEELTVVLTPK